MATSGEPALRSVAFPSDGAAASSAGGMGAPTGTLRAPGQGALRLPVAAAPAPMPVGAKRHLPNKKRAWWITPALFAFFFIVHTIVILAMQAFVMRDFYQIAAEDNGINVAGKVKADVLDASDDLFVGNLQVFGSTNSIAQPGSIVTSSGRIYMQPEDGVAVDNGLTVDSLQFEGNTITAAEDLVINILSPSGTRADGTRQIPGVRFQQDGIDIMSIDETGTQFNGDVRLGQGATLKLEPEAAIVSENVNSAIQGGELVIGDVQLKNNVLESSDDLTITATKGVVALGDDADFYLVRSARETNGAGASTSLTGQHGRGNGNVPGGDVVLAGGNGRGTAAQGRVELHGGEVHAATTNSASTFALTADAATLHTAGTLDAQAATVWIGTDATTTTLKLGHGAVETQVAGDAAIAGGVTAQSLDHALGGTLEIGTASASAVAVARGGVTTTLGGDVHAAGDVSGGGDATFDDTVTSDALHTDTIAARSGDSIDVGATLFVGKGSAIIGAVGDGGDGVPLVLQGGLGGPVTSGANHNGGDVVLRGGSAGAGGSGGEGGVIDVRSDAVLASGVRLEADDVLVDTLHARAAGGDGIAVDAALEVLSGHELRTDTIRAASSVVPVVHVESDTTLAAAATLRVDTIDGTTMGADTIAVKRSLLLDASADVRTDVVRGASGASVEVAGTLQSADAAIDELSGWHGSEVSVKTNMLVDAGKHVSTPTLLANSIDARDVATLSVLSDVALGALKTLSTDRITAVSQSRLDVTSDLQLADSKRVLTDIIAASASPTGVLLDDTLEVDGVLRVDEISAQGGAGVGTVLMKNNMDVEGDIDASGTVSAIEIDTALLSNNADIAVEATLSIDGAYRIETNTITTKDAATLQLESNVDMGARTLSVNTLKASTAGSLVVDNDVDVVGTFTATTNIDTPHLMTARLTSLVGGTPLDVEETLIIDSAELLRVDTVDSTSGGALDVLTDIKATGDILVDTIRANAEAEVTLDTDVDVTGMLSALKLASNKITSASTGTVLVESSDLEVDEANMLKTNTITTAGSTATAVTIATDLIVDSSNTLTVDTVDASAGAGKVTVDTSAEVTGTLKVAGVLTAEDGVSTNKLSHTGNIDVANTLDIADGQSLITDTVTSDNGKVTITAHLEVAAGSELQADTIDTSGAALEVAKAVNVAGDVSTAGVVSAGSVDTDTIDSTSSATINVVDVLNAQSGLQSDTITSSTGGDVTVSTTLVVADGEELHANTLVATAPASVITVKNDMTLDSATLTTPTLKVATMNNDANGVTVDDNLIVNAVVKTDELMSATGAQVHVNDHLEVDSNFELRTDTIVSAKDDQQVTVSDDLTVTGVATVASLKTDTIVAATAAVEVGSDLEVDAGSELRTNSVQPTSGGTVTIGASGTTTVLDGQVKVSELNSPDGVSPIIVKTNFSFAKGTIIDVESVTFQELTAPLDPINVLNELEMNAGKTLRTDLFEATTHATDNVITVLSTLDVDEAEMIKTNTIDVTSGSVLTLAPHVKVGTGNTLSVDVLDAANGAGPILVNKAISVVGSATVDALTTPSIVSTVNETVSVLSHLDVDASKEVRASLLRAKDTAIEIQGDLTLRDASTKLTANKITTLAGANLIVDAPTVDFGVGSIVATAVTTDALSGSEPIDVQSSLKVAAGRALRTDTLRSTSTNAPIDVETDLHIDASSEVRVNTLRSVDAGAVLFTEDVRLDSGKQLIADTLTLNADTGGVVVETELYMAVGQPITVAPLVKDGEGTSLTVAAGDGLGHDGTDDYQGGNLVLRGGKAHVDKGNGVDGVVAIESNLVVDPSHMIETAKIEVPLVVADAGGVVGVDGELEVQAGHMLKADTVASTSGAEVDVTDELKASAGMTTDAINSISGGGVAFGDSVILSGGQQLQVDTIVPASSTRIMFGTDVQVDTATATVSAFDQLDPDEGPGMTLTVRGGLARNGGGGGGDGGDLKLSGGTGNGAGFVDGHVISTHLFEAQGGADVAGGLSVAGGMAVSDGAVNLSTSGAVTVGSGAGEAFQLAPGAGSALEIVFAEGDAAALTLVASGNSVEASTSYTSTNGTGVANDEFTVVATTTGNLEMRQDGEALVTLTRDSALELTAGVSESGGVATGGAVELVAGTGTAKTGVTSGTGGNVELTAGDGFGSVAGSVAGNVVVKAGDHDARAGGHVQLTAGTTPNAGHAGGDVTLRPGSGGTNGAVRMYPAVGNDAVLTVDGDGDVELGSVALNTQDVRVTARELVVDQSATVVSAKVRLDTDGVDFVVEADRTDFVLTDGSLTEYMRLASADGGMSINSLDVGGGAATIDGAGDLVVGTVSGSKFTSSELVVDVDAGNPGTNATITLDVRNAGNGVDFVVRNDETDGELVFAGAGTDLLKLDGAAQSVWATTLTTAGALSCDTLSTGGDVDVNDGDLIIQRGLSDNASILLKVNTAQEDFTLTNLSLQRQLAVRNESTTLGVFDSGSTSVWLAGLQVGGGGVGSANASVSAGGALVATSIDTGNGLITTTGNVVAGGVSAPTGTLLGDVVEVTTSLDASGAAVQAGTLDVATSIATTGTLEAGDTELAHVAVVAPAGSGQNVSLEFDTDTAHFSILQDNATKRLVVSDLDNPGDLLTVNSLTGVVWVDELAVGPGTLAAIDDTGAATVASLDAGNGTIETTGALSAGATTVGSLAATGDITTDDGGVGAHHVDITVTSSDDAVLRFDVNNSGAGEDFQVLNDESAGVLKVQWDDGGVLNDVLVVQPSSVWLAEAEVAGATKVGSLEVTGDGLVGGALLTEGDLTVKREGPVDVVLKLQADAAAVDFVLTNEFATGRLLVEDEAGDDLITVDSASNFVHLSNLSVGGTLGTPAASVDTVGNAQVASLDAGSGPITTSGPISTVNTLDAGNTTVSDLHVDQSASNEAKVLLDVIGGKDFVVSNNAALGASGQLNFEVDGATLLTLDVAEDTLWVPEVRIGNGVAAPASSIDAAGNMVGTSLNVGAAGPVTGGAATFFSLDINGGAGGFQSTGALTAAGIVAGGDITAAEAIEATGLVTGSDLNLGYNVGNEAVITFDVQTSDFTIKADTSNQLFLSGTSDILVLNDASTVAWAKNIQVGGTVNAQAATISSSGAIDGLSLTVSKDVEADGKVIADVLELTGANINAAGLLQCQGVDVQGQTVTNASAISADGPITGLSVSVGDNSATSSSLVFDVLSTQDFTWTNESNVLTLSGATDILEVANGTNTVAVANLDVGLGAPSVEIDGGSGAIKCGSLDAQSGTIKTAGALEAGTTTLGTTEVSSLAVEASGNTATLDIVVGGGSAAFTLEHDGTLQKLMVSDLAGDTMLELESGTKTAHMDNIDVSSGAAVIDAAGEASFLSVSTTDGNMTISRANIGPTGTLTFDMPNTAVDYDVFVGTNLQYAGQLAIAGTDSGATKTPFVVDMGIVGNDEGRVWVDRLLVGGADSTNIDLATATISTDGDISGNSLTLTGTGTVSASGAITCDGLVAGGGAVSTTGALSAGTTTLEDTTVTALSVDALLHAELTMAPQSGDSFALRVETSSNQFNLEDGSGNELLTVHSGTKVMGVLGDININSGAIVLDATTGEVSAAGLDATGGAVTTKDLSADGTVDVGAVTAESLAVSVASGAAVVAMNVGANKDFAWRNEGTGSLTLKVDNTDTLITVDGNANTIEMVETRVDGDATIAGLLTADGGVAAGAGSITTNGSLSAQDTTVTTLQASELTILSPSGDSKIELVAGAGGGAAGKDMTIWNDESTEKLFIDDEDGDTLLQLDGVTNVVTVDELAINLVAPTITLANDGSLSCKSVTVTDNGAIATGGDLTASGTVGLGETTASKLTVDSGTADARLELNVDGASLDFVLFNDISSNDHFVLADSDATEHLRVDAALGEVVVPTDQLRVGLSATISNAGAVAATSLDVGSGTVDGGAATFETINVAGPGTIVASGLISSVGLDAGGGNITNVGSISLDNAFSASSVTLDESVSGNDAVLTFDVLQDATGADFVLTVAQNDDEFILSGAGVDVLVADVATGGAEYVWLRDVQVGNVAGAPTATISDAGALVATSLDVGAGGVDGGAAAFTSLDLGGAGDITNAGDIDADTLVLSSTMTASGLVSGDGLDAQGGDLTNVAAATMSGDLDVSGDVNIGTTTSLVSELRFTVDAPAVDFFIRDVATSSALVILKDGTPKVELFAVDAVAEHSWSTGLAVGATFQAAYPFEVDSSGDVTARDVTLTGALDAQGVTSTTVGASGKATLNNIAVGAGEEFTVDAAGEVITEAGVSVGGDILVGYNNAGTPSRVLFNAALDYTVSAALDTTFTISDDDGDDLLVLKGGEATNHVEVQGLQVGETITTETQPLSRIYRAAATYDLKKIGLAGNGVLAASECFDLDFDPALTATNQLIEGTPATFGFLLDQDATWPDNVLWSAAIITNSRALIRICNVDPASSSTQFQSTNALVNMVGFEFFGM